MTSVTLHLDRWGTNMERPNQSMQQPNRVKEQSNNVKDLLGLQNVIQARKTEPKRELIEGARRQMSPGAISRSVPVQGLSPAPMSQPINVPKQVASLNTLLKEDLPIHVADLKDRGISPEGSAKMDELEQQVILKERGGEQVATLQEIAGESLGFNPEDELKLSSTGGLIGMAAGGMFDGRVRGDGHGMQDNVFMPIKERGEQIATLAVSPKEYVVDAHTMSAIGNGNADKGADVMDNVVENIREKAYGTDQQPNQINGLAALRPMIERV